MVAGHTKFSCDRCFGVLKKKTNTTPLWTIYDIAKATNESGECNHVQLIGDHLGNLHVESFDWAKGLSNFFKKIPVITDYHHFKFDANKPGIVSCSVDVDKEYVDINILKPDVTFNKDFCFEKLLPNGLPLKRQWYLYKEVRPFCKEGTEDIIAPKPSLPEPVEEDSAKRKAPKTKSKQPSKRMKKASKQSK